METYKIIHKSWPKLPEEAYEIILSHLYDCGVEGVEIKAPWSDEELNRSGGDYIELGPILETVEIKAYIKEEELAKALPHIGHILGTYEILDVPPSKDWLLAYQQYFKTFRVGNRFVIVPSWESYTPNPEDLVIRINPNIAFGTGSHPTTRNVLLLMEEIPFKGKSVADVGAGSGILSYGAALLGAEHILLLDNDPDSIQVSKDNLKDFENIEYHVGNLLEGVEDSFDVILANIVADVIVHLAAYMDLSLKPGGTLIVSGILEEKWTKVLFAMDDMRLRLVQKVVEDGWVTASFMKDGMTI